MMLFTSFRENEHVLTEFALSAENLLYDSYMQVTYIVRAHPPRTYTHVKIHWRNGNDMFQSFKLITMMKVYVYIYIYVEKEISLYRYAHPFIPRKMMPRKVMADAYARVERAARQALLFSSQGQGFVRMHVSNDMRIHNIHIRRIVDTNIIHINFHILQIHKTRNTHF